MNQCDTCVYYAYDEDFEDYYCEADVDQDDYGRIAGGEYKGCPFYRNGDDYAIVRHQM